MDTRRKSDVSVLQDLLNPEEAKHTSSAETWTCASIRTMKSVSCVDDDGPSGGDAKNDVWR